MISLFSRGRCSCHSREVGAGWFLWSLPNQIILWFSFKIISEHCCVLSSCMPRKQSQPLKCTRRAQHLAAGAGWSHCWGLAQDELDGFRMAYCWTATKIFLSFFLGSLEFAPGRVSEVLRTKRLCHLYFSPPATYPLPLHICSARDHLPPFIGNKLGARQPSDCLPVNNLLTLKQSSLKRQQSWGQVLWPENLWAPTLLLGAHCRLLIAVRPKKKNPTANRNSAEDPWLIILMTQDFNPPCQPFPPCLAGGIQFPKCLELMATGEPHTDQSADKSRNCFSIQHRWLQISSHAPANLHNVG